MNIKEKQQNTVDQEKPNFGQFIDKNKGVSMRDLLKDGDNIITKMQSVERGQFQIIDLPSRGWGYAQNSPLSSGKIKLRLPTGKDQAILSSQNLLKKGLMIDQFLRALIVDNIKLQNILTGDKNYLVYASRRMAYGNNYPVELQCSKCGNIQKHNINLSDFTPKVTTALFDFPKQTTEFQFTLPISKKLVKFKLNDGNTEKIMEKRVESMKQPELQILIRTATLVIQIDEKTEFRQILTILQNIPAKDTLALRFYIQTLTPDIDVKYKYECSNCYREQEVKIPLTAQFFWPNYNS